jgi:hypothetical protein
MVEEYVTDGRGRDADTFVTVVDTPRPGISWPAIFAGAVTALMTMLVLNLLATGIGLTSFDLTTDSTPLDRVAGGLGWAVILINLISLALGGWVAGRVAGGYRLAGGFLHGFLSWAVVTLVTFWLLTSAAGSIMSGIGSAVSSGLNLAAQGVGALAPAVSDAVDEATGGLDVSLQGIREDLTSILTGAPAGTTAPAQQAGEAATTGGTTNPALAQAQVRSLLDDVFSSGEDAFSDENKQQMVTLLTERTGVSEAEAQELVDGWERSYVNAQARLEQAQQELTAAADEARAVLSRVALLGALGLVLGALISGWLGNIGANRRRESLA